MSSSKPNESIIIKQNWNQKKKMLSKFDERKNLLIFFNANEKKKYIFFNQKINFATE